MSSCERSCPEEQEKERGNDMSPRIWYGRRVTTGASRSGRLDFGLVYHVGRQPFAFFWSGKRNEKAWFLSLRHRVAGRSFALSHQVKIWGGGDIS